jgi:sterol desaturase/sphingolipid hydroxylase (fatty acid hydroxylase superfamily)
MIPSTIEKKQNMSTLYHYLLNFLNVFIQDILINYYVICDNDISIMNFFVAPFIYFILQDVYFYFIHKLLHNKYIYKYIHKTHHEITDPNIFVSYYENPLEHIFAWSMPYLILPNLISINYYAYIYFVFLSTLISLEGHSSYSLYYKYRYIGIFFEDSNPDNIYLFCDTTHHDIHHKKISCNYGLYTTLLDRLFLTLHKKRFI